MQPFKRESKIDTTDDSLEAPKHPRSYDASKRQRPSELKRIIKSHTAEIVSEWCAALAREWGSLADKKIGSLHKEREAGSDPLSVLQRALQEGPGSSDKFAVLLLPRVRHPTFTILDLATEISCLEQALERVLHKCTGLSHEAICDAIISAHVELGLALRRVLRETSEIYEHVLESGGRGFCHTDQKGRILYANTHFKRLVGSEHPEGQRLGVFFAEADAGIVMKSLMSAQPLNRVLNLRSGKLPVGAEVGALLIGNENRGGFARIVDIANPLRLFYRVFEDSPLGIGEIDANEMLTYANRELTKMLGSTDLVKRHIKDVLADDKAYRTLLEQLRHRKEGRPGSYELEFKRLDNGQKIQAVVNAMPKMDSNNHHIGSIAIIRNVLHEKVADEIYRHIASERSSEELLRAVVGELRRMIPLDRFSVAFYEDDARYVRSFFVYEADQVADTVKVHNRRWWELSEPMRKWVRGRKEEIMGDFEEWMSRKEFKDLKDEPIIQRLLAKNLRSILSLPVYAQGTIKGSMTCYASGVNRYNQDHLAALKELPLEQAVRVAISYEERDQLAIRLKLFEEAAKSFEEAAKSSKELVSLGDIIVKRLAECYDWSSVSIFQVDVPNGMFRLLSQWAKKDEDKLKDNHTQPLDKGVMGYAYRTGEDVLIGNVHTDPKFKDMPGQQNLWLASSGSGSRPNV